MNICAGSEVVSDFTLNYGDPEPKFCGYCGRALVYRLDSDFRLTHAILICAQRNWLWGGAHDRIVLDWDRDSPKFSRKTGEQLRG